MSFITVEKLPTKYNNNLAEERNKFNSSQLVIIFVFLLIFSVIMSIQHYVSPGYKFEEGFHNLYFVQYLSLGFLSIIYFITYLVLIRRNLRPCTSGRVNLFFLIIVTLSMNLLTVLDLRYGHDLISYIGLVLVLATVLWLKFLTFLLLNTLSLLTISFSVILFDQVLSHKLFVIPQVIVLFILGWLLYFNNRKIRRDDFIHRKQLERYNEELLEVSIIEPMTGLYNRRTLDESLKKVIAIHYRAKAKYSLMLIDIDYFKSINDKLGHIIGDSVIEKTSAILKNQMRESDIGFRYGGEEFLLLLSNTNIEEAAVLAERIRKEVSEFNFEDVNWNVTVSIGIAEGAYHITGNELISIADKCLYKAKDAGRNRVVY